MFKVIVGKPCDGQLHPWPETVHLTWRGNHYILLISLSHPRHEETEAIRNSQLQIGACRYHDVLAWGLQFGNLPWMDCSYSWHLQQAETATLPLPSAEPVSRPLSVILIENSQGIVQCIRNLTLPAVFVQAWEKAVREQARKPWNVNAYDARLQILYGAFSSQRMVRELAFARCRIGGKEDLMPGQATPVLN